MIVHSDGGLKEQERYDTYYIWNMFAVLASNGRVELMLSTA